MLPHHRGNRLWDGLCPLGVGPDVAPWVTGELGPLYFSRVYSVGACCQLSPQRSECRWRVVSRAHCKNSVS